MAIEQWAEHDKIDDEQILLYLNNEIEKLFAHKAETYSAEIFQAMARRCLLATIDQLWKDHLYTLDHLRQSIVLRAYGQKDPLNEYKREAFHLFEAMMDNIKEMFIKRLAYLEFHVVKNEDGQNILVGTQAPRQEKTFETRIDPAIENIKQAPVFKEPAKSYVDEADRDPKDPSTWGKIGRNESCPCGSGNKYKQCHGKI